MTYRHETNGYKTKLFKGLKKNVTFQGKYH